MEVAVPQILDTRLHNTLAVQYCLLRYINGSPIRGRQIVHVRGANVEAFAAAGVGVDVGAGPILRPGRRALG